MKDFDSGTAFGAGLMLFIGCIVIALATSCQREEFNNEAVKAGKAEYYLDSNNIRQWRWKQ